MNNNRLLISKYGKDIANVRECSTAWEIGIGLIGEKQKAAATGELYQGIYLRIPSWRRKYSGFINSIHMIGMKYPIAAFWVFENIVVDKVLAVPGFHIYSPSHAASGVIELPEQALSDLNIGELISISYVNPPQNSQAGSE
ncbi:MAG: hypothetical protein IJI41_05665 [Anaerolineaceae bacterium]|nr:hypothetical protein [Anaerolineaceae bacterium]